MKSKIGYKLESLSEGIIMCKYLWLNQLETLAIRFSYLGIGHDINSFNIDELDALYFHLSGLEGD